MEWTLSKSKKQRYRIFLPQEKLLISKSIRCVINSVKHFIRSFIAEARKWEGISISVTTAGIVRYHIIHAVTGIVRSAREVNNTTGQNI
jgi:hypothetical protein